MELCTQCVSNLYKIHGYIIKCPSCRQNVEKPEEFIGKYRIPNCLDCGKYQALSIIFPCGDILYCQKCALKRIGQKCQCGKNITHIKGIYS